jgi:hypothetical protein
MVSAIVSATLLAIEIAPVALSWPVWLIVLAALSSVMVPARVPAPGVML